MGEYLLISDAAKQVKVESHVLRYWEEELHLPIKRNELGHRYYTKEDVERFKEIKSMKERGLQMKAIKMILKDGKLDVLPEETTEKEAAAAPRMAIEIVDETVKKTVPSSAQETSLTGENREEKVKRLQWILQQMIREGAEGVISRGKAEPGDKTITVRIPAAGMETPKLAFEFINNNFRSALGQSINISEFTLKPLPEK